MEVVDRLACTHRSTHKQRAQAGGASAMQLGRYAQPMHTRTEVARAAPTYLFGALGAPILQAVRVPQQLVTRVPHRGGGQGSMSDEAHA